LFPRNFFHDTFGLFSGGMSLRKDSMTPFFPPSFPSLFARTMCVSLFFCNRFRHLHILSFFLILSLAIFEDRVSPLVRPFFLRPSLPSGLIPQPAFSLVVALFFAFTLVFFLKFLLRRDLCPRSPLLASQMFPRRFRLPPSPALSVRLLGTLLLWNFPSFVLAGARSFSFSPFVVESYTTTAPILRPPLPPPTSYPAHRAPLESWTLFYSLFSG